MDSKGPFISPIRLLGWLIICVVVSSPVIVGIFPVYPAAILLGILFLFSLYAFSPFARSERSKKVALLFLSVCFALAVFDVTARHILFYLFENRPTQLFIYRWPALPQLYRFAPDVKFQGTTYGDLAAMSGRREWRENKQTRFVTDAHGFKNEIPEQEEQMHVLDLIVLGDSYGVASGTSQESTLSGVLARMYRLHVYNLSMDGANPWQKYINLTLKGDMLKTSERTIVLWMIFSACSW